MDDLQREPIKEKLNEAVGRTATGGGLDPLPHLAFSAATFVNIPAGAEALIVLHLEQIRVNDLREPLHHWSQTLLLPVRNGRVVKVLPDQICPGEVSTLSEANTLARLEREISRLEQERQKGRLIGSQAQLYALDRSLQIKQEEVDK